MASTELPGYRSYSTTKESGAPPQPLPARVWTTIDLGPQKLPTKGCIVHAQIYFEGLPSGEVARMSIRTGRGNGNDTGQHDFLAIGPTWSVAYTDVDYVKDDKSDDARRSIEVYSDKACQVQTRIMKVLRPVVADAVT